MTREIRTAIAPAYIFLCLLLGGSAQGIWANAVLQLIAVGIIGSAILDPNPDQSHRAFRPLMTLTASAVLLAAIQLIPLPPAIWKALPGRGVIEGGQMLLGAPPEWMPISLAPFDGIATLLALLPALGALAASARWRSPSRWIAASVVAGCLCGILLGILQALSTDPINSPWYPYRNSNFGVATGFFANGNHMATLLLVTIPCLAALGADAWEQPVELRARMAGIAVAIGGIAAVLIGLALNGSLAGYGLAVPVTLASLLMFVDGKVKSLAPWATGAGAIGLLSLALLAGNPIVGKSAVAGAQSSLSSRQEILSHSFGLLAEFAPIGSGLGTFVKIYPLTENPDQVDAVYVNHAHNDYLELAIETGAVGAILMIAFLAWWGRSVWRMLKSPASDRFALAAAIATAAVLLHSAVDYPLRTAAISAVFAACLSLILQSRRGMKGKTDLRAARHLDIG